MIDWLIDCSSRFFWRSFCDITVLNISRFMSFVRECFCSAVWPVVFVDVAVTLDFLFLLLETIVFFVFELFLENIASRFAFHHATYICYSQEYTPKKEINEPKRVYWTNNEMSFLPSINLVKSWHRQNLKIYVRFLKLSA